MIETGDYYHLFIDDIPRFSLENFLENDIDAKNLIDFLDHIKAIVRTHWADYMVSVFNDLPDSPKKTKLFNIFQSETSLRTILDKEKFRELEMLRLVDEGEFWREIVTAISEREIATIGLAKHFLDHLTKEQQENLSLSKQEIDLFLDLSFSIQHFIDQAYIHQLALADEPGGKQVGTLPLEFGYEYLYDDKIPYSEVYSDEFTCLTETLNDFSNRIEQEVEDGLLSPDYLSLAHYLTTLSKSYGSKETNIEKINQIWEDVDREYISLAQQGCPIILTPWGFLTDGNHIGIELMVTLNLGSSSKWHKDSEIYRGLVRNFMRNYEPDFEPVPFIHQYVFVRNGLNIPWSGTACASNRYVVFYDNENDNFSANLYHSYYDEFIDGNTSENRFAYVRGLNTVAHETGHLGRMLNQDLYQKMGNGVNINKLDEAKADSMATLLFSKDLIQGNTDVTPSEFIEQYIVDYIDEIRGARGHETEDLGIVWYDFSAKLMLLTLFESNSIIWSKDKIKIIDGYSGMVAIAGVGKQIFNFYGDEHFDSQAVSLYIQNIEERVFRNADIQKFLAKVTIVHR